MAKTIKAKTHSLKKRRAEMVTHYLIVSRDETHQTWGVEGYGLYTSVEDANKWLSRSEFSRKDAYKIVEVELPVLMEFTAMDEDK